MKKIITCFLVSLLLFVSLASPAFAEDVSVKEISISVDFHGNDFIVNALQNEKGEILVPARWIQYFGSMKMVEEGRYYKFYYVGQEEAASFAKRIYIEKNGKSFDIRYYENNSSFLDELTVFKNWMIDSASAISSKSMEELRKAWKVKERELKKMEGEQNNSFSICSGKFSDQKIYQDQLYLPLKEVLPFLNAKVGISEEGKVWIYPNCISLSQALYEANLGDLTFDAYNDLSHDGKSYADGLSGTAYVADTILNFRFDRLLFQSMANTSDYEKLFKTYLTDDEVYLAAFNKEVTPQYESYNFVADAFEDGETVLKSSENIYKIYKAMDLPEELYSSDFYEALYKDYGGSDVKGMDIIEGFSKIFDYQRTYSNQVEDHRYMLTAVFSRDFDDLLARYPSPEEALEALGDTFFSPAYIAASNIEDLYGKKYSDRLVSASAVALRDYVSKDLPKELTKTALAPFSVASAVTKLILPEEFKLLGDYALIGYMDNSAATAYDAYLSYKFGDDYSAETLNKLRLSAIMALISSKHAYTSIWDENHEKIKDIDALLTKLYLAADGVECDSSDYYGKKKAELEKNLKKITTEDGWDDNFDVASPNSNDIIGTWYATIDGEYGELTFNADKTGNVFSGNFNQSFQWKMDGETLSISTTPVREMQYRIDKDTLYLTFNNETQVFVRKQSTDTIADNESEKERDDNTEVPAHAPETTEKEPAATPESYFTYKVLGGKATITGFDKEYKGDVVIPKTLGGYPVTNIGKNAFKNCKNLTSVTIPNSVIYIGVDAFYSCSLTSVTIPNSVTSIGRAAFSGCSSLTSITIGNGITIIGDTVFSNCKNLTSVTIPNSVTTIDYKAFAWCDSLASVTIPDSVTHIGYESFTGCKSLTNVTIGKGVISIGFGAFEHCNSLASVTIPNSVTSIEANAFFYCSSLASVTIPNSVTKIGADAFWYCSGLKDVYYAGSEADRAKIDISTCNDPLKDATWHYNS